MASSSCTRVLLLCCGSFNPITNMHLRMFEIAKDYLHRTGNYKVLGGIISPVNDAYGKKDLIDSVHRLEMCRLALQSSDWIKVDSWECEQNKWHPTAKVLKHHQQTTPAKYMTNKDAQSRGVKRRRPNQGESTQDNEENNSRVSPRLQGRYKPVKLTPSIPNTQRFVHSEAQDQIEGDIEIKLLCGADLLESFAVPGLWSDQDMEYIVNKHGLVVITREGSNPHKFVYESDVLYRNFTNIHIVTEWIYNEVSSTRIRRALNRNESIRYLVPDPVVQYIKSNELYHKDNNKHQKTMQGCCLCVFIHAFQVCWQGFVK
ncbi:nicotinamide/nicotinic acid mononucleotide adenylyltransferase 1-like isoform X1 [Antedon mediterranea]|uniref:nicotinamide/nicotinic acid mononucleotide adenylyltransferase 1-like isoform X1 n=1 Tax=Antedon mediterranea TaxID=105859 RepID=UPI003AF768AC